MISKTYSIRDAINTIKEHRDKLEIELGKKKLDRLLFNLEEISLDLESISKQIIDVAKEEPEIEKLTEIFDFFQYGSIPHILGHLETIEELLEEESSDSETSGNIQSKNAPAETWKNSANFCI
ncbi:hypothetical protein H6S82_24180 [Planktothrix sp. FACHB-1355]|uniref:Uncharacterized protein n=1 Tax=Aerosakkonema funiforme FACHB-1375 TaxID=2949571 RepID=A0A926VJG5_9CYAN|nr:MULTISPECIES: hypothetical protein [Oscillatoriales]MBD2184323.1 hypothetical protein [Aerosakkonema funiforme FACHB-1375]MBD3561919.1 hypothetical protein [Planktothrix sp. FACHB-1355]